MNNEEDFEDDLAYPQEDIERIVNETTENSLKDKGWDENIIPGLTNEICETVMQKLVGLNKPYKYVISCVLQQRGGTTHMSTSCHWENTTDGQSTYIYPPIARAAKDQKAI